MKSLFAFLTILFLCLNAFGTIRNVPDEYESIQAALDGSQFGDTVLIAPGVYWENLVLTPPITIASYRFVTGNRAYIDSTVVDGRHDAPCFRVEARGNSEAVIDGLTIQHGLGDYGGGVSVRENATAAVQFCKVQWNAAYDYGGGIAAFNADVFIDNCVIRENETDNGGGGGVYLFGGHSAVLPARSHAPAWECILYYIRPICIPTLERGNEFWLGTSFGWERVLVVNEFWLGTSSGLCASRSAYTI